MTGPNFILIVFCFVLFLRWGGSWLFETNWGLMCAKLALHHEVHPQSSMCYFQYKSTYQLLKGLHALFSLYQERSLYSSFK